MVLEKTLFLVPGGRKTSQSTQKWGTMMGCAKRTLYYRVVREWITSSLKNSKISLFEGLFSELFRGEPKSPARGYVCVCAYACVGESSSGKSEGKEDWGVHRMTWELSLPAPQVHLLQRINCQLSAGMWGKGYWLKVHTGEKRPMGLSTWQANIQQTEGFTLTFLLKLSLLINTEQLRVSSGWSSSVPTCLQAIGFLLSSFAKVITSLPFISHLPKICWKHLWQIVSHSLWPCWLICFQKFLGRCYNEIWVGRKVSHGPVVLTGSFLWKS